MTILHIRYIFLLLLFSSILFAKEKVDIAFEVLQLKENYMDIAQKKAFELRTKGFKCYILKNNKSLSLRCNDAHSIEEMQKSIAKFKKYKIPFLLVNKTLKNKKIKKYKTPNEFYLGYAAYNRKEYKKALRIFKYNYQKTKSLEHAFAYALALMKMHQYAKALKILKPYRNKKKAKKLYNAIATTFMYKKLDAKQYEQAKKVVRTFMNNSRKYNKIIKRREVDDLLKQKKYNDAKSLAKKYSLTNKIFESDYLLALDFVHKKEYQQANIILAPYIDKNKKAKKLFVGNVLAMASKYYEQKEYDKALYKLKGYWDYSPKIQKLYYDILFTKELQNGWKNVSKSPRTALQHFKKACKIKEDEGCYSGLMYSYFNLHMYEHSFYIAKKLFNVKKSDEYALVAMRSLLQLKKYNEAQVWFSLLRDKKGITDPALLVTFMKIDKYIKEKRYEDAQNIINYLLKFYPENIAVLKKEMQVYVMTKEYKKAANIANKILQQKKHDSDAKYALALYDYTNEKYQNCINEFEDMNVTQAYQKELYNQCNAYYYANKKDINRAIEYMEKIDDDDIKASFYLKIGDIYKRHGYSEAIRAYEKAKEYQPDNFDLEILYLYALKDFLKDEKVEEELAKAYKKYPDKKEILDKFKQTYQKERLYSYYKNHRNGRCYRYGKYIANELKDKDVYRMTGWCAYALKKYEEAKRTFANINYIFGESTEDIYAYALSCYQNQEYTQASEALNRLKTINSKKYALLVASLYIDLHEQERAKKILLKLPESYERDAMLVKINKSYTKSYFENATSVGMYYQSQSGLTGKNRFQKYVVPVDYDYVDKQKSYHLYLDGDLLYLYNGYLGTNGGSYLDFGLNATTAENDLTSDIGFMPKIGLENKKYKAEIGLTPVGAKITPALTWLLSADFLYNKLLFNVKFKQEAIDETMLSFVGERAQKNSLEVNWGRVLKRGFEGGISYNDIMIFSLNVGYYPKIFGLNVIDNSEFKGTFSAVYHPQVVSLSYVDLGTIIGYDSYDRNSNLFTYGHGGYFSPQEFWMGSLFVKFGDIVNNKFYYQSKLAIGFQGFVVDDAEKFPLPSNDVSLTGIQKGYSDGGLTYKVALQLGYNLTKNMDFVTGFSLERMNNYKVQEASFAFVYRFNESKYRTFNSFGLNHRVNKIIK